MPNDTVTLSDLIEQGHARLRVACRSCEKHGVYGLEGLIKRNGDSKLADLLLLLTASCPARKGASTLDSCEAFYPLLRLPHSSRAPEKQE